MKDLIDITPIINAVIMLIVAIITTFLIPWIKSKISEQQQNELEKWVKIAVEAAEMIYKGISGAGEEKKAHVIEFLESKGFTVDHESLDALIESAVYQLQGDGIAVTKDDDNGEV